MRSNIVIIGPPEFKRMLRFFERVELLDVQALIS